jgi:hypothetical protein
VEYGLHHPGNIVPCCTACNKRKKDDNGRHVPWEEHLKHICEERSEIEYYEHRRKLIYDHISNGEYAYPALTDNEKHAIRVIAESLYSHIRAEIEKSLDLYGKLTDAFVKKREEIKRSNK